MSNVNASKRGRDEEGEAYVPSPAGRGGDARPPGALPLSSVSLQDTLAAIQAQLTLQTSKMETLAQKGDVKGLSKEVERLSDTVGVHSAELEALKRSQKSDKDELSGRIADLERRFASSA